MYLRPLKKKEELKFVVSLGDLRTQVRHLLAVALFINCGTLLSCNFPPRPSAECRDFYALSFKERESKIRASNVEGQLSLYYCGMYQEPPTDYADVIAEQGASIAPTLLERLRAERSETRQDFIIHIFERMAERGFLKGSQDTLKQLRDVVNAMKDERIRLSAQQRLKAIEEKV